MRVFLTGRMIPSVEKIVEQGIMRVFELTVPKEVGINGDQDLVR